MNASVSYYPSFEDHSSKIFSNKDDLKSENIWTMPWGDIAHLQILPGYKLDDDLIVVPEEWVPLNKRHLGKRTIDFSKAVPAGWSRDDQKSEMAIRRLKRICFLDLTQTVSSKRGRSSPCQPLTWVSKSKLLLNVAKDALLMQDRRPADPSCCSDGGPIFQNLTPEMFAILRSQHKNFFQMNVARLNGLKRSDRFDDWPAIDVPSYRFDQEVIRPFSDAALTQILRACFFLGDIQEDLENCWREISSIKADANGRTSKRFLEPYKKSVLAEWHGRILHPGFHFPFAFNVTSTDRKSEAIKSWPLKTPSSIHSFLRLCQAANAQIVHLAMAGRVGELISLQREPLEVFNGNGLLNGFTFKQNGSLTGVQRQWPIPTFAVEAIRRQTRLLTTMEHLGAGLWMLNHNNKSGSAALDSVMTHFGKRVQLLDGRTLEDVDNLLTSHRFRKTMARLVGLTLEGASGVLYDVLGHTNMDVTLGYMLSDPEFQADADLVRREVQAVRRKEIAAELDDCGGLAAESIREARDELRARGIHEDLGEDNVELLVTIMPALQQVGPNRFCTATSKDKGLCSKVTGQRDVGACSSSCMYRLERAVARKDAKDAIHSALDLIVTEKNIGTRAFYHGQIVAKIAVFDGLLDEFTGDPRLVQAFEGCDRKIFANLRPETLKKLLAQVDPT